jgi:ABC-type transport system involved in cytochrome bd biosynthesis fused ATPase/permease subunit
VMHADEILVMDGGRIVERGKHEDLIAMRGHYHGMWALQQRQEAPGAVQQDVTLHESKAIGS